MSSSFSSKARSKSSVISVICIMALVAGLLLAVVGCGGGEASIVGKWLDSEGTELEFTEDGKILSDELDMEVTYEIADGQITLDIMGMKIGPADYTLDSDSLTMMDPETGEPDTLTRVK